MYTPVSIAPLPVDSAALQFATFVMHGCVVEETCCVLSALKQCWMMDQPFYQFSRNFLTDGRHKLTAQYS